MANSELPNNATHFEIEARFIKSVSRLNRAILAIAIVLVGSICVFEYVENLENSRVLRIAETVNLLERQRMYCQEIGRLIERQGNEHHLDLENPSDLGDVVSQFVKESDQLNDFLIDQALLTDPVLKDSVAHASRVRFDMLESIDPMIKGAESPAFENALSNDAIGDQISKFMIAMNSVIIRTNEIFSSRSQRQDRVTLVVAVLLVAAFTVTLAGRAMRTLRLTSISLRQVAIEKHRLAVIAERTNNAVVVTDIEGRIVWVNAGFTRITDYTLEEVLGKKPGEFLQFEKTDKAVVEKIRRAIQSRVSINCQIQNRSKYGREYWLELNIQTLCDHNGSVNGFMAVETDITMLKEVENQIREEQRLLMSTLDSLTSKVAIVNRDGFVICANQLWVDFYQPSMKRWFGDISGTNFFQILRSLHFIDPLDAELLIEGILKVLRREAPYFEREYALIVNRETRWFRAVASPCTRNGKTKSVVSTEDITVRIEAEQKVQAYASRVQAVFDGSSDAIFLSKDGTFFDCNQKALQLFGIANKDQLVNTRPSDYSPVRQPCGNSSIELANMRIQEAIEKGSTCFEWIHRRLDGETFPAEVLLSCLYLEGTPVLLASVRDISERKETLRYLEMYRSIVDRHAIVAETDTAGNIVYANDQFCTISGYSRDELLNKNHRILNSGLHPKTFWRDMFRTVVNHRTWRGEVCNRSKRGELYWVDTTVAPLINHDGKIRGYFAIRHDITALKKSKVAAQSASDAKSQFIANMSHEIRTPMTAILGFADLLAQEVSELENPSRCVEYVGTIKRNGEHLLSIINDILDISKIEANKMDLERIVTSPSQIIQEVVSLMQVKADSRGIDLRVDVQSSMPGSILSDPTRIRQILLNLVGNAIKFTEKGTVSLIVNCSNSPETHLRFVIRDSGIGMTEEQVSRLFSAFYQADASVTRRFGGSGLGLQISKRLALMLGGDLTAKSTYGHGSEFTFTLPYIENVPELGIPPIDSKSPGKDSIPISLDLKTKPLEGVNILLAEDGEDNQKLIAFHLKRAGATVTIAQNGKEAIELLTKDGTLEGDLINPEQFDLILTDMQMPEMDGYSATRLLRSKGCLLPIIALTANAMSSDAKMCLAAGCNEHVSKPVNSQQLIQTCLNWTRQRQKGIAVENFGAFDARSPSPI